MAVQPDDFADFVDDVLGDAEAAEGSGVLRKRPDAKSTESVRLITGEFFIKQGWRVVETLPMITAYRVVGTSFVTDESVNSEELVGARSKQAETAFARMEVEVYRELRAKAQRKGAGAVVGVRVEFGEVGGGSGKGHMFYAFVQGTPVLLAPDPYQAQMMQQKQSQHAQ
jgi:uncharacterized protein YbjQ (UPF0145 family)